MVSTRMRVINGALVVAVAGAVTGAVLAVGDPASGRRATGRTATVRTGTVTATVTTSGTVQSATQDAVSFQQSGTVTAIYVKVGQKVAAGARLAAIDATSQQLSVNAAEASLEAARDGLAAAEAGTPATSSGIGSQRGEGAATATGTAASTRPAGPTSPAARPSTARSSTSPSPSPASPSPTSLSPSPSPSSASYSVPPAATATPTATDSAGSHVQTVALRIADASAASPTPSVNPQQVAQARAQVYQAQAQLAQAQKALDETVLTAPVAGTVQAINGSLGGASVAGGQAGAAGTSSGSTSSGSSGFVVLTDLGQLQVKGEIAEADIAKVQVGQPVTYTFATSSASAAGAPAVTGSVQSIDVTATVSNNVVEYGVTLSVEDPPAGLRLGQTATASIQTGSVDGALYVPSTAVTTLGTRSTVTVQDGSGTHVVPVTLGLVGDADTQITSGLSEGQTVVLPTTTTTGGTGTARFPGLGGGGLGGFGR